MKKKRLFFFPSPDDGGGLVSSRGKITEICSEARREKGLFLSFEADFCVVFVAWAFLL
jgi:hypothetical protein